MTKNKQKDNPKFSFLFGGEYFNYYQYKVTTEQASKWEKNPLTATTIEIHKGQCSREERGMRLKIYGNIQRPLNTYTSVMDIQGDISQISKSWFFTQIDKYTSNFSWKLRWLEDIYSKSYL